MSLIVLMADPADPFRVVAAAENVTNDLAPEVLFSAKYRGAVCEEYTLSVGANFSTSVPLQGSYSGVPQILASMALSNGGIIQPYYYATQHAVWTRTSGHVWGAPAVERFVVRASATTVVVQGQNLPSGGTIKLYAFG